MAPGEAVLISCRKEAWGAALNPWAAHHLSLVPAQLLILGLLMELITSPSTHLPCLSLIVLSTPSSPSVSVCLSVSSSFCLLLPCFSFLFAISFSSLFLLLSSFHFFSLSFFLSLSLYLSIYLSIFLYLSLSFSRAPSK